MNIAPSPGAAVARFVTLAALTLASPAFAQSYHDVSGTIITGDAPLVGCSSQGPCLGPVSAANPLPVSGAVQAAGTLGTDFSANKPTPPNIGAGFGSTGPYANYVLIATVAASSTRNNIDIENTSGAQIAIVRDDGTASFGSSPNNASLFALGGGAQAGTQGGSWSSQTFRGRLQIYAPTSTAQVAVFVD